MGWESSVWTFPAPHRDSHIIPEMRSQFIPRDVRVMLLSERFPGGRDLLAWTCCFKVQRSIRRSRLCTQASNAIDAS